MPQAIPIRSALGQISFRGLFSILCGIFFILFELELNSVKLATKGHQSEG